MPNQTSNEPNNSEKLNVIQRGQQIIAQRIDKDHAAYAKAFLAIQTELRAFRDAIVVGAEEARVAALIQSELLSVQTVQMNQIMLALQVDSTDAMLRGHKLANKMMQAAGVDAEQIAQRQKLRTTILEFNGITDDGEKPERY